MTQFGDLEAATKVRDIVRGIVLSELNKARPVYKYAEVTSIDTDKRTCDVLFPGETVSVTVKIGSIFPREAGQYVRVAGLPGDRYVDDVLGDTGGSDTAPPSPPTHIAGTPVLNGIRVTWLPSVNIGIGEYQVEVATNAGFTQMIQSMYVSSTFFEISGLLPTQDYFVRVRALNGLGQQSVWTPSIRVIPSALPVIETTTEIGDDSSTSSGEVVVFNQVEEVAISPVHVGEYVFDADMIVKSAILSSSVPETTSTIARIYKNGVQIGTDLVLGAGATRDKIVLSENFTGGETGDALTARIVTPGASARDVTVIVRAE